MVFTSAVIPREDQFLMVCNNSGPYLRGFWEFPRIPGRHPPRDFREQFVRLHGLPVQIRAVLEPVFHQITFRRLTFYPVVAALEQAAPRRGFAWLRIGQSGYPMSAYVKKIHRVLVR
jgi:hypothetical protein